ncbi:hypothetical protein DFR50_14058 [Roseiarcus fermentans]|uniref:Uncharacterized protein n=1 Tax=Roseiarcus fermentans TaxID=1473586 RepID=A0A366ERT6_9HYPH|nr:hypothetical protein [Roseiarcus fermentans]RBP04185.1 hypothetical protein DFR50_14058 [Roseiarcus fermentans]
MADSDRVDQTPAYDAGARRPKKLDPLVRYMIFHWIMGTLGGALCATLLLVFDPFGLWPLMHDSGLGLEALLLLYIGFMTSFGGLVCAAAVMFPPKDDDEPPRGGLRGTVVPAGWKPAYVRVPSRVP